jgi:CRP-like cAMP-binding protein
MFERIHPTPSDRKLAALARHRLFAGCTRSQLVSLGSLLEGSSVEAGTEFQTEAAPARWLYAIAQGCAVAREAGAVSMLSAGDLWAPRGLLAHDGSGKEVRSSLTALSDLAIWTLDQRSFGAVSLACPSVAAAILDCLDPDRAPSEARLSPADRARVVPFDRFPLPAA